MDGAFMIAFNHPCDALEWCLLVQEIMMEIPWSREMLSLDGTQEVLDSEGVLLWRGPKVKAGVYQGVPTKVRRGGGGRGFVRVLDSEGVLLWRGPKVEAGVYQGVPTNVRGGVWFCSLVGGRQRGLLDSEGRRRMKGGGFSWLCRCGMGRKRIARERKAAVLLVL